MLRRWLGVVICTNHKRVAAEGHADPEHVLDDPHW